MGIRFGILGQDRDRDRDQEVVEGVIATGGDLVI